MGGSSEREPTAPAHTGDGHAGDGDATQSFLGGDRVAQAGLAGPTGLLPRPPAEAVPSQMPTEVVPPRPATEAVPHRVATEAVPPRPSAEVVRYGPGVPASQAGLTAERVWRTGRPPTPPRRPHRLWRLSGSALTVILLAASGLVLYLRVHHAPFHVTGVMISQRTRTSCGVDVTGRITTNGSAGTVSYQWLLLPDLQPPQPLNQSVTAGQHAVYVTTALEGSGHGSASRTVTLQVLGPDPRDATTAVVVRC